MRRYFPGVSKTHNKKVVNETPQKADARDYEKTRPRRECLASKNISGRVPFECHSPGGRVLRNLSFQPCGVVSVECD